MLTHLFGRPRGKPVREITARGLEALLGAGSTPVLIDIRDASQFAAAHLPGALHIPMARLAVESSRLDPAAGAVVY